MSGQKVAIGKGFKIKDGRLVAVPQYRDASHAIRCKKSKRQKVVRPTLKGD
jgi:hypothetical protein